MLSGIVGIVSGGASGLGAAATRALLRKGGKVVVADLPHQHDEFLKMASAACIDPDRIYNYNNNIAPSSQEPILAFSGTDVTSSEDVNNALDVAEAAFGNHVNVAISCAGMCPARKTISKKRGGDVDDGIGVKVHPLDLFSQTMNVNVMGTFNVATLSASRMALRDAEEGDGFRGCIINTASIAAFEGQRGQVAYASSKGAVVGMTLPLARDLSAFGIRVMTIAPGLFGTPLLDALPPDVKNELGSSIPFPSRLGDPDEFGQLVVSILENQMLNGEVIRLDGAVRMPP